MPKWVLVPVVALLAACGGGTSAPDSSPASSGPPSFSSSPSERVSRAEFVILAANVCVDYPRIAQVVAEIPTMKTRKDQLVGIRTVAALFGTTHDRAAVIAEEAPAGLEREFRRSMVVPFAQLSVLYREIGREYAAGHTDAADADLDRVAVLGKPIQRYSAKYHLDACG
jgi:hypothetical protein